MYGKPEPRCGGRFGKVLEYICNTGLAAQVIIQHPQATISIPINQSITSEVRDVHEHIETFLCEKAVGCRDSNLIEIDSRLVDLNINR